MVTKSPPRAKVWFAGRLQIQDAFYPKPNGYFAAASRDATLTSMRTMREKGLIDWTIVAHQYTRLLEIAVEFGLLEIFEPHVEPRRNSAGKRVVKGRARIIGPGTALPELRAEFQQRYDHWKARQQSVAA